MCVLFISPLLVVQAPTFLDLAGWTLPDDMDGESLKSVILGEEDTLQEQVGPLSGAVTQDCML